ncbi:ubiquitin, partial [Hyaloscypha finlandica]
IQVFIKLLSSRSLTVQTQNTATVRSLWAILLCVGCSPESGWRLIFGGKQLEPERFLSDYNIQNLSTLQLVLRLSGGF